jgi:hypothetical protein
MVTICGARKSFLDLISPFQILPEAIDLQQEISGYASRERPPYHSFRENQDLTN